MAHLPNPNDHHEDESPDPCEELTVIVSLNEWMDLVAFREQLAADSRDSDYALAASGGDPEWV